MAVRAIAMRRGVRLTQLGRAGYSRCEASIAGAAASRLSECQRALS